MAEDKHEHEQPHVPAPGKGAKIPAAAVAAAYAPHAAGEDDASAEANSRIAAEIANRVSPPIPANQLVTAPTSGPLADGGRAMYVLVGPYRGNVLTMTDADGESAKDNHWAIDIVDMNKPFDADNPYGHDHELTDEDRAYAVKEANEWAAAQNPPPDPEGEDEAAPEGETEGQRQAREKRNADRKAQRERDRKPQPDQRPAQQPGQHANHKGKAATPQPAGTYETR